METKVRLYSILSEVTGLREITVDIERSVSLRDLVTRLSTKYPGFRKALEIVGVENLVVLDDSGRRLSWDDRVKGEMIHIMPPPEGGEERIETGILTKGEIVDINKLVSNAVSSSDSTGAVAIFIGAVRSDNFGKNVKKLIYEDAGRITRLKLDEIAREVFRKYGVSYLAAYHYIGELEPGDLTMIVVVASRSRKEAFPAMEELVEAMKRKLPIWKKEVYTDGSYSYILGGKSYNLNS